MKNAVLFFALFLASALAAQNTVTGTIVESNGNPYANGSASAQTVPATGHASVSTTPVATSATGFFSMSLPSNTYIFTICAPPTGIGPSGNPTPKQVCFRSPPITISANIDLGSQLSPLAPVLGPVGPLTVTTVAGLNSIAGKTKGTVAAVIDGASSTDCTVGGGTTQGLCQYSGTTWGPVGSGTLGLQTNGVNNASQTTLNIINSTANAVGLTLTCANPSGGNEQCEVGGVNYTGNAATATNVAYPGITAGSNTTAKTEGTGGSLSPLGIGQVAGSQVWIPNSLMPPAGPTLTGNQTGGTLTANHQITVQFVFNSAAGTTWPSVISTVTTPNPCTGGSVCSVTVTAPTIPTGYTGYTTYDCDSTGGACAPLQQAALSNCVNLGPGVNCTIGTLAAGAALPTTNTAWVQPPNVQANECPPSVFPFIYGQTNDGNFHTWAGMDTNTSNNNVGQLTFCRKVFFTDLANPQSTFLSLSEPISYNNAFIAMNHEAGVGTNIANQDRLLGMLMTTPTNDSATRHAIEGIQLELDKNCNGCAYIGGPDAEVAALSLQLQDNSVTNTSSNYGTFVERLEYFRAGTGFDTGGEGGIRTLFSVNNNTGFNGIAQGYSWELVNASGSATGLSTIGFWTKFASGFTAGNGQIALYASGGLPGGGNNGSNQLIRSDIQGLFSNLNGPIMLQSIQSNQNQTFNANASFNAVGSLSSSQVTTAIPAPTIGCTGGASTYTYQLVGVDGNGGQVAGNQNNCTTGTNPLTVGNPATITPPTSFVNELVYGSFIRLDVYRVGGPMATGKVGSITCSTPSAVGFSCGSFSDTGLAATGAIPTVNTTGGIGAAGLIAGGNTVRVANDFTSVANTNLQTITGLTWNVSQAAAKYSFHCSLNYSQATAAASMQFGIQIATVAPNSVDARGRVDTSATAVASGTLNGLNTTTATAIVTFTPSAAATVFGAELDGTLDLPQNNAGNQINIMVQTSNSADLPTVKKGSYCSILP